MGKPINTYAAAKREGFRFPLGDHYGGESIVVRGQVMLRNYETAKSATAWTKAGYIVRPNEMPHAQVRRSVGGGAKNMTYDVYRADQVVAKEVANG